MRAFLKIQRPRGAPLNAVQLAAEYEQVVAQVSIAPGLEEAVRTVWSGWSRGAAFTAAWLGAIRWIASPAGRLDGGGVQ